MESILFIVLLFAIVLGLASYIAYKKEAQLLDKTMSDLEDQYSKYDNLAIRYEKLQELYNSKLVKIDDLGMEIHKLEVKLDDYEEIIEGYEKKIDDLNTLLSTHNIEVNVDGGDLDDDD